MRKIRKDEARSLTIVKLLEFLESRQHATRTIPCGLYVLCCTAIEHCNCTEASGVRIKGSKK